MLATKINEFLEEFIKEDNKNNSVLINGKYGCGKTYNINKFFNDYNADKEKLNYIYLSLFGTKSIDEIIVRLSERIDSSYIVNIDSHFFIPNISDERAYNGGIIIFDDIDRKSDEIEYNELFGLISSLRIQGFKIITVINEENVFENEEYFKNIEKTFDKKIVVTGDNSVLKEVIGLDLLEGDRILEGANDNLRLVIKAKAMMDEITNYINEKKAKSVLKSFDNPSLLLRCVIIALRCEFWNQNEQPFFDEKIEFNYEKDSYEEDKERFQSTRIANALHHFFNAKEKIENHSLYADVKNIIYAHLYGTFDCLINYEIESNDIMSTEPFNNVFFYLDDEGKLDFQKKFIEKIDKFDFTKRNHLSLLAGLIKDPFNTFAENDINKIANAFLKFVRNDEGTALIELQDYLYMSDDADEKKRLDEFIKIINKKIEFERQKEIIDITSPEQEQIDYNSLITFLRKNENKKDAEMIAIELSKEKFLLPDLSKKMDYTSWLYCHEIAKFVAKYERMKFAFLDVLIEQMEKSDSKSLNQRCNALAKYNFNINFDEYYKAKKKS